jgi:glycyl-tRNA synthetase beta chain
MAEWLLEILSEEIPARMQPGAQLQLKTLAETHLNNAGLGFEEIKTYVTPRRLVLVVQGLSLEIPEKSEEKKGPLVTAPQAAIEGFLKTNAIAREQCVVRPTPKGDGLFILKTIPAQQTYAALPEIALAILKGFSWPKSMRWGAQPTPWVRPIRGLLSLFEGKIVPFTYAGVTTSNTTYGHRFLAPGPFTVKDFKEYERELEKHFVMLEWDDRRHFIKKNVAELAEQSNLAPLNDDALLDEVAGLVEWPIALKGTMDARFMDLPREVITTPMRHHQRYFPLENTQGNLAAEFIIISNTKATDDGKTIVVGNERVLRARLADAEFFWKQDLKMPLVHFNEALKTRLFHQHLGSLFDKVQRLVDLSTRLAKTIGANASLVARAALLSKADLASQMVAEFPELQGIMGKYYAQHQGEPAEVAQALEEQYWPKGTDGHLPQAVPSLLLGLADRLDTLIGFFTIGATPTGSKDPYALRRAALGVISLCLAANFKFSIREALMWAYDAYPWADLPAPILKPKEEAVAQVWNFLLERFKFFLKDKQGSAYDHVEAVLSVAHDNPSFADLALRTKALDQLMGGEDGQNLLAAYKRAANILTIEEEKEKRPYTGDVREASLETPEEKQLFKELQDKAPKIEECIANGDFVQAVQSLAGLRPFVDQFFNKVVVNVEDAKVRETRLQLLALLRKTLHQVADFSKIEG